MLISAPDRVPDRAMIPWSYRLDATLPPGAKSVTGSALRFAMR